MKNLTLLYLLLFGHHAFAQSGFHGPTYDSNSNFFDLQQKGKDFFSIYPDARESGSQIEFQRWQWFWQNRVDGNGSFGSSVDALLSLLQNPVCTSSPFPVNWSNLGPGIDPMTDQALGIVCSIAFDPNDPTNSILYVGTTNAGLWKTIDGGQSWASLTESLQLPGLGVQDIKIDPSNSNIIFIATGISRFGSYGIGVLKSIDGGATWNTTGLSFTPSSNSADNVVTRKLLINPVNTNIIYAIADDRVYKSTDGGVTWPNQTGTNCLEDATGNRCPILQMPPSTCFDPYTCSSHTRQFVDMEMHPTDNNTIYVSSNDNDAATYYCGACGNPGAAGTTNGGAELWKTDDAGATWTELTGVTNGGSPLKTSNPNIIYNDEIAIAVTPAEPNSLFIHYGGLFSSEYFQKSVDGGLTWNAPNPDATTGIWIGQNQLIVSPNNPNIIYAGAANAYESMDGGVSWFTVSDYNPTSHQYGGHADVRAFEVRSVGGNEFLFMGNDGGACLLTNNTVPWVNITPTLPVTQFFGLAGSEKNPGLVIAGAQDIGIFTSHAGSWCYQVVGDGFECAIDNEDPTIWYGEGNPPGLFRADYGCGTWLGISQPGTYGYDVRPISVHPLNNRLYTGFENVFGSSDKGNTWSQLSDFGTNFNIPIRVLKSVEIAPSNPNIIYASYDGICWCGNPSAYFFMSTTGGGINPGDWIDLTANLPTNCRAFKSASLNDIVVNPNNAYELWIVIGGFSSQVGINKIFHSINGGVTWDDYSSNLPIFPANTIVYENGSNGGLYLGTDIGVFYTNNEIYQSQGWVCFGTNFPVVIVTDLEINYASNKLRAATYGRGVWESQLACPVQSNISINALTSTPEFDEAQGTLTACNAAGIFLPIGYNLTYRATEEITLLPGFEAKAGCDFTALIHGCDAPGNSFRRAGNFGTDYSSEAIEDVTTDKSEIDIFPNPTLGIFVAKVQGRNSRVNSISVTDVLGKNIWQSSNNLTEETIIDISGNPKGVYFIKIEVGNNIQSQRIALL